jgi:hypothetical protein
MYGSVGGQQPILGHGVPPQFRNMPPMQIVGNPYGSSNGGGLYSSGGVDQAAMYQNAMAQAAAHYHALASAYGSTQGQAPVQLASEKATPTPKNGDPHAPS